jgi:hypothetical protein
VRWVYDYTEEQRTAGRELFDKALLRPTVRVQFRHGDELTQRHLALVDSGSDHVLTPAWVGETIGIEPDPDRSFLVRIGGRSREVRLAEVEMLLLPPDDCADEPPAEWSCTVGFFSHWIDPPWLVILGQLGFFDQFTVQLSRQSQRLAVLDRDHFDHEFPSTPAIDPRTPAPRFKP